MKLATKQYAKRQVKPKQNGQDQVIMLAAQASVTYGVTWLVT